MTRGQAEFVKFIRVTRNEGIDYVIDTCNDLWDVEYEYQIGYTYLGPRSYRILTEACEILVENIDSPGWTNHTLPNDIKDLDL